MPAVFEYPHTVAPQEIDILGHANNLAYVAWMQSAALAHSAAQGWPTDAYQRLGAGWVVRTHQITYRLPAFAGEPQVRPHPDPNDHRPVRTQRAVDGH